MEKLRGRGRERVREIALTSLQREVFNIAKRLSLGTCQYKFPVVFLKIKQNSSTRRRSVLKSKRERIHREREINKF